MNNILIHNQRKLLLESLGILPDPTAWGNKLATLRWNAKCDNRVCSITFEQYVTMASEAGIVKPDQIGRAAGCFQMGRIGDDGDYEIGNCRFITQEQNHIERKLNGKVSFINAVTKIIKTYSITSPDGEVFNGSNLSNFCRDHNLHLGMMSMVCNGKSPHHKGWKGSYVS